MIPGLDFIGLPMMYAITFFALFNGLYIMCVLLENRNGFKSPKEGRVYTLSAIVPVYNGAKHLKECVESLQGLNYPEGKVEIIVVDDGSKDNSYEIAKKMKGVRAYRIGHAGKSAAVNFGIEKAKGELIGILDVDSSVSPDALRRMTGFFSDKKVGAVHSGMRVKNKGNFIEKFQELEYMFALLFKKIFSTIDGLYVTPGVFSVYRKSLFRKIGMFDTGELSEDLEIAFRMISKKYVIKCAFDAKTYTVVPDTFRGLKRQRVRWNAGLVKNLKKYSNLLSGSYGELGYFVLPFMILGHISIMLFFSYVSLSVLISLFNNIYLLYLVGAETFISGILTFGFAFGFIQSKIFFYTAIVTLMGLGFLYYAKSYVGHSASTLRLFRHYVAYILVSGYVYFYFWLSTIYGLSRREIRW